MTTKTITALIDTRLEADRALAKLEAAGFTHEKVSLLVTEDARKRHFGLEEGSKADEGAVMGATIGGLSAALYMGLVSGGALLIPGLAVVVSGAAIAALAGLGAGAVVGGLTGALVGAGIPEHEARVYEKAITSGMILVAVIVTTDKEEDLVRNILKAENAQSIKALAA